MARFRADSPQGVTEVARHAGMSPGFLEFELDSVDYRPFEFDHHVVPVVAILARYVHAARKGELFIDDDGLDMVARQPGIGCHADVDIRLILEVVMDRGRSRMPFGQAFLRFHRGYDGAESVQEDLDVDTFPGTSFEQVGDAERIVIVIEDIHAQAYRVLCAGYGID